MLITKQTTPTTLPLALNDLKDHLRIERDELDYDDDLTILIRQAAEYIESDCHVTLINTQYTAVWDDWPADRLCVPAWPLQTIDSIAYVDGDGDSQTWSSSLYRTSLVQVPGYILPEINQDWPDLQADAIDAVTVTFTAGYGTAATDIPWQIQGMIKLLVAHWFKHREAIGDANVPYKKAYDSMRDHVRVNEWTTFLER